MIKTDITIGLSYLEVPEEDLRILCGCPENSIKFIMQKDLTPPVVINGLNLVSGPNCILLNDLSVLNSHYLNFAEFPVLHQQYFQGAAFNGKNEKFKLIGSKDRVKNQVNYIQRGLHGLYSMEEILEAGVPEDIAEKVTAIGNYHRGNDKTFNIIDEIYLSNKTQIKGDLYIERISLNKFEFTYKNQKEIIDINLGNLSKGVGLPYNLDHHFIEFDTFSITTVGDGNGWNQEVPCMGALINSKGKRFLVDSGPGSIDLIKFLGITASEVEGVFVTHSHDDHFAGILSLLNSENKVKFFSTALIITSVQKKFQALLNISKADLRQYIDFIELKEGEWTNIGEMEVKPKYSFHTIETNVFYFRAQDSKGDWKTYGHITDIISKKDLNYMLENDKSGVIKEEWTNDWFNGYLEPCDLKRVDVGGGVVHGDSNDFINDKSKKIILSHLNHDIDISKSDKFLKPTEFGHTEVLIPAEENYLIEKGEDIIRELSFLTGKINTSINFNDIELVKPNQKIVKKGDKLDFIYMILSGIVIDNNNSLSKRRYVQGDFLYTFNNERRTNFDFISSSFCYLLKIKSKDFHNCIKILNLDNSFNFLRNTNYFSYGFSLAKIIRLSRVLSREKIKKNSDINFEHFDHFFVHEGLIELYKNNKLIKELTKDSLSIYAKSDNNITFKVKENSIIFLFSNKDVIKFPSLLWSIYEEGQYLDTIVETGLI